MKFIFVFVFIFHWQICIAKDIFTCKAQDSNPSLRIDTRVIKGKNRTVIKISLKNVSDDNLVIPKGVPPWNASHMFIRSILEIDENLHVKKLEHKTTLMMYLDSVHLNSMDNIDGVLDISRDVQNVEFGKTLVILWKYEFFPQDISQDKLTVQGCVSFVHTSL